jgi:hypothetical protein
MTALIVREAACSCGQLRIRTEGEPRIVSSCHCLACQRRTGALFGANAFFARQQVVAIDGESSTFRRQGDTGGWRFGSAPNAARRSSGRMSGCLT